MTKKPLIYDANGRPTASAPGFRPGDFSRSAGGWDAVGGGRRARSWQPSRLSSNALLGFTGDELRAKSSDAYRRNPWAIGAVESWVSNVVGTGMWPMPRMDDETSRCEWVEAWDEFGDVCDADEVQSINGMQEAVVRSMMVHGEAFIRIRRRTESAAARLGLEIPVQFQLLPADQVDYGYNANVSANKRIRNGIEFNRFGKRLGYWMWTENPNDMMMLANNEIRRVRIPADDIIHVFHQLHPGQMRGIPGLSSILTTLFELAEVGDAHILRQKIQNYLIGVVEKPNDEANPIGGGWDGHSSEDDVPMAPMEPGTWQELLPGETVKFSSPPASNGEYEQFITTHLRSVAVGAGTLYEHTTGDWKGVTFSSARAALIELRRKVEKFQQNVLVYGLMRRIYREFAEAGLLAGRLSMPSDVRLQRVLRPQWIARPGWAYVDPLKEAKATVELINAGVTTRSREVLRTGIDPVELDNERAAEKEREERLGIEMEINKLENDTIPPAEDDDDDDGAEGKKNAA